MTKFVEITNFDGDVVAIYVARIVYVRRPTARVHDHGSVTLDTGEVISFYSDGGAERLLMVIDAQVVRT